MYRAVSKGLGVFRREGAAGAWSRLRNPKRVRDFAQEELKLPLQILGTNSALVGSLMATLTQLLGEGAVAVRPPYGASIAIDPTPGNLPPYGRQDVLFFTQAEAALGYLGSHGSAHFSGCNAIFLPDPACIDAFVTSGVTERILFLLSDSGAAASTAPLLRWLLFCGLLPVCSFDTDLFTSLKDISAGDQLCISLPESTCRRSSFHAVGPQDFRIFDGIKRATGWQGCGWSYASIARAALKNRAFPITICEDDMRPNAQFDAQMEQVRSYLGQSDWDIFSGLLTNLSESCKISRVERRGDLTFVHLDFMTGMVLNVYGRKALERLADWTPSRGGPEVNTIDAWLGRAGELRVVTVLPFLASHASEQESAIFGFRNKRYDSMIAASERRLNDLVAEFEAAPEVGSRLARKRLGGSIRAV